MVHAPQAANRGKQASVADWKAARQALHEARDAIIAAAGPLERERLMATMGGGSSGVGGQGAAGKPKKDVAVSGETGPATDGGAFGLCEKPAKVDILSAHPPVSL